jgi:hypothetical protein
MPARIGGLDGQDRAARLEKYVDEYRIAWKIFGRRLAVKNQDRQKSEEKKKPVKTLKEKRAEKKAKKDGKTSEA